MDNFDGDLASYWRIIMDDFVSNINSNIQTTLNPGFATRFVLPPLLQCFQLACRIQHPAAGFPVNVFNPVISHFKGMALRNDIDDPFGLFFIPQGGSDPDVFQSVRDLAEHIPDILQSLGQELMNPVLHGILVAHVIDQYLRAQLADPLNPSFALFQPRRVPGKVEIDERPQSLEVEPLRGGVRSDDQAQFPGRNSFFDFIPVHATEGTFFDDPRFRRIGVDADLFVGHAFR